MNVCKKYKRSKNIRNLSRKEKIIPIKKIAHDIKQYPQLQ